MTPYRLQHVKLSLVRSPIRGFTATCPEDVARAFAHLTAEARESFYAVYLSATNEAICVDRLSTGSMAASTADPAEVVRTALLVGARALILVHNHPGGSPTPSPEDLESTRAIVEAAALFQLQVLDHVIVGRDGHYSFKAHGTLPTPQRRSPR